MLIPVTSYVKRYLSHEYGPGPYDLGSKSAKMSRLRLAFLSTNVTGILYPSLYCHEKVNLEISKSPALLAYYQKHESVFNRGCYFADDFFNSFFLQVRTLRDHTEHSYESAINIFMAKYQITEEEYSLENMQRQISRFKRKRKEMQGFRSFDNTYKFSFKLRA